ncbi:NnrS family protein [Leptospira licerasiae]|uniref:NnrS family protein n=1 Tax=Leptospira licerasiae TaxID=447106 RepID=UPI001083565D|nr:NnrS family protein [Leptospira licerasiae]TGM85541.1 NnrS family protein [Leptospira licerasiae]
MKSFLDFRSAIWSVAFRPFFLVSSFHAIFAVLVWILILFSIIPSPFLTGGIQIHSYEMVFGFGRGAIIGFLFTAGQNWTKKVLAKEGYLALLFGLWFIGRFGFLSSQYLSYIALTADLYCDLLVLFYLAPPLFSKGQEHNRVVVITYFLLFILHVLTAFSFLSILPEGWSLHFIHLSLFIILQFVILIGGRIMPFFSSAAIPGSNPKRFLKLESIIRYGGFLFLALETFAFWLPQIIPFAGLYCLAFGMLNYSRWLFWEPWKSRKVPILWILHFGYFWLCSGFLAYGLSHLGFFPTSSAFHIFTVGGIGVFVYGMITRVSLGHTGRPIKASKAIILGYILINLAVIARVFLPLMNKYREAYLFSSIFWISAFLIFAIKYSKILISPRAFASS